MDDLPLPDGYRSRRLTREDAEAVTDIVAATELDVDGAVEIDVSDVRVDWERPNFDQATMSIGVAHGDELVAFGEVYRGRAEVDVLPRHRGRGSGSALMRWTWETARRDGRAEVSQILSDAHDTGTALLRANAYEVGHVSWVLRIALDGEIAAPELPEGFAFRNWLPGADDRAIWRVIEDAFSEWPGRDRRRRSKTGWRRSRTTRRSDPTRLRSSSTAIASRSAWITRRTRRTRAGCNSWR